MGRKPVNCTPPVRCDATRLLCLTSQVVIHSETPRSYTKFHLYSLEILSVLNLDHYKLRMDTLDKLSGHMEYKETDWA
jgi:hypothetical protein